MVTTETNPPLDTALVGRLTSIWADVTNAGGAVGFVGPVTAGEVAAAVEPWWAQVREGEVDLVVARDDPDGAVVGFGFLAPVRDVVAPHRGMINKLQRHPTARARGVGTAVLHGLEACARRRGLTVVGLTVRGGTGREGFYTAHGYQVVGVHPDWLEIDGEMREQIVMAKRLDGRPLGVRVAVTRLDPDLPLPTYARPGDAGLDLHAREDLHLAPGERALMPTGIAVAIPDGHVGLVHPRSGLAIRHGLSMVNTPGTIDAGYRGELQVPLINLDPTSPIDLRRGDRIAQLVIQRVEHACFTPVDRLDETERGTGGFGHTGR